MTQEEIDAILAKRDFKQEATEALSQALVALEDIKTAPDWDAMQRMLSQYIHWLDQARLSAILYTSWRRKGNS